MTTTLLKPANDMKRHLAATRCTARRERGIALVVALVFLVMLTILGVSVMSTASLEGVMAANSQETNRAFHGAESAIQNLYADKAYGTLIRKGDTRTDTVTYGGLSVTVATTYKEQSFGTGRSKNVANIFGSNYSESVFDYTAQASNSLTKARSEISNGKAVVTHKSQ